MNTPQLSHPPIDPNAPAYPYEPLSPYRVLQLGISTRTAFILAALPGVSTRLGEPHIRIDQIARWAVEIADESIAAANRQPPSTSPSPSDQIKDLIAYIKAQDHYHDMLETSCGDNLDNARDALSGARVAIQHLLSP